MPPFSSCSDSISRQKCSRSLKSATDFWLFLAAYLWAKFDTIDDRHFIIGYMVFMSLIISAELALNIFSFILLIRALTSSRISLTYSCFSLSAYLPAEGRRLNSRLWRDSYTASHCVSLSSVQTFSNASRPDKSQRKTSKYFSRPGSYFKISTARIIISFKPSSSSNNEFSSTLPQGVNPKSRPSGALKFSVIAASHFSGHGLL